jgi:hypothetical protein
VTSGAQEVSTHLQAITAGHMATRLVGSIQALLATPSNPATKRRQLGPRTWEAVRPTRNDVSRLTTLNNRTMFEVCRTPPLLEQHETAIVDSGCTGHFLLVNAPCLNKVESRAPLRVRLPNGATIESSHTADLDIPELNAAACKAHVSPGMAHHSLLSVGQLCNEGYIVTFKQDTVTICNSESSKLLSGPRDVNTELWRINLKQTNKHIPDPIANNVYELSNTGSLFHYLHKALFSPT